VGSVGADVAAAAEDPAVAGGAREEAAAEEDVPHGAQGAQSTAQNRVEETAGGMIQAEPPAYVDSALADAGTPARSGSERKSKRPRYEYAPIHFPKEEELEYKHVLLDIEGTTTTLAFVSQTLVPFAQQRLVGFLDAKWDEPAVRACVAALREEAQAEGSAVRIPGDENEKSAILAAVCDVVSAQMAADRKAGPLKQLQALIWADGYASGALKGEVFSDVAAAFRAWEARGVSISIYSSGAVAAQRDLFSHTSDHGDLTSYIRAYFDTSTGSKQESDSYRSIAKQLDAEPASILFVTDVLSEASAAQEAGMQVAMSVRRGNAPLEHVPYRMITSLMHLLPPLASCEVTAKSEAAPTERGTTAVMQSVVETPANTKHVESGNVVIVTTPSAELAGVEHQALHEAHVDAIAEAVGAAAAALEESKTE